MFMYCYSPTCADGHNKWCFYISKFCYPYLPYIFFPNHLPLFLSWESSLWSLFGDSQRRLSPPTSLHIGSGVIKAALVPVQCSLNRFVHLGCPLSAHPLLKEGKCSCLYAQRHAFFVVLIIVVDSHSRVMLSWEFLRLCEWSRVIVMIFTFFCCCLNWIYLTILPKKQALSSCCLLIFIVFRCILMFTCPDTFTATNEKIPTLTT